MASRRKFLVKSAALAAAVPFSSRILRAAGPAKLSLWMGSCARGNKDGIFHSVFDPATGHATEPTLAADTRQPSFFCTMPDSKGRLILYSVNELGSGDGNVSAFLVNNTAGKLTLINHVSAQGAAPCYISARPSTRTLYTANYNGGSISVFHAAPDGSISALVQKIDLHQPLFGKPGPNIRQGTSHPHSTTLSPDGRYVIVNDLGDDKIDIFRILPGGKLDANNPLLVDLAPETGPRHVAFHPNGHWVYGVNELANTLQQYSWLEGQLNPLAENISTMQPDGPAPVPGEPLTAAEVAISPDGRFLYACTRGDDSLTVFEIAGDGELTFRQRIGSGGKIPRQFTLDPTGNWIVCCNNNSPAVTIFQRNSATGFLTGPIQTLAVESPEFALFT